MKLNILLFFSFVQLAIDGQNNLINHVSDISPQISLLSKNYSPNVSCYRIPSMITAVNGDLIVAVDERVTSCGDLKWNDDINIVIRRSRDNGNTWSGIEKIIDNKCLDYEKRLKITQKYIASCKGNKGEKPTCRIEKYITNG